MLPLPAGCTGVLWALLSASFAIAADAPDPAGEIQQVSGITNGLCIQIGFVSPDLLKCLARSGRFVAYGLSDKRELVAAARTSLLADGLSGLASADVFQSREIPCVNCLVNLLVVEDAAALLHDGLSPSEFGRVLAPNGVVCLGVAPDDGKAEESALVQAGLADVRTVKLVRTWVVGRKPRPAGMDDWTHPTHGPDGNQVSLDRFIEPPDTIRWCTGPTQPNPRSDMGPVYASVARMTSLNGRNFYLMSNGQLVARDGFNGLILWTSPVGGGSEMETRLVVAGDRLCVSCGKEVRVLDPASGSLIHTIKGAPWVMLGLTNRLVTVDPRTLCCFDLVSGAMKWATTNRWDRPDGCPPVAAGNRIYSLRRTELTAVDVETGTVLWRTDVTNSIGAGARLNFVQADMLMCRKTAGITNVFHALSVKNGSPIWAYTAVRGKDASYPGDQPFFADGLVWVSDWDDKGKLLWKGLNPVDGAAKRTFASTVGGIGCHPMLVTDRFAIGRRPNNFMSWKDGKSYENPGSRGACGKAPLGLANGQLYLQQCNVPSGCVCGPYWAGISGWAGDKASTQVDETDRWEKGALPAAVMSEASRQAVWPMFRHDGRRSNSTSNSVPASLKILWTRKLDAGRWPASIIRSDWLLRVPSAHLITGPTLADGRVFVSLTEAGAAVALDERDGRLLWSFPTGGRLDTPPTAIDGLSLVGSHDGCVYGIDAATGKLAWRFRAAPTPRRMLAYGQVESSWPVVGGVLTVSNLACVVAGRTSEMDGGLFLYGLNARTGSLTWTARWPLPPGENIPPYGYVYKGPADVLVCDGPTIAIAGSVKGRFDAMTGAVPKWTGIPNFNVPVAAAFNRVCRNPDGNEYPPCPIAFTEDFSCGPVIQFQEETGKKNVRHPLLLARTLGAKPPADKRWEVSFPAGTVIESIVIAGDTILCAIASTVDGKRAGELLLFAAKDGSKIAAIPLPVAPVYEALAVGQDRVFVSLEDGSILCLGPAKEIARLKSPTETIGGQGGVLKQLAGSS